MENLWRTYRPSMERYRSRSVTIMASRIEQRQGSVKILDVGTGLGYLAINLSTKLKNASITGVDLWEGGGHESEGTKEEAEKIAAFKNVSNNVRFAQNDACNLGYADSSFDVCVSSFLLSHIRPPREPFSAIMECKRILKPNGLLSFCDVTIDINTDYDGKWYMNSDIGERWLKELGFTNIEIVSLSDKNHIEIRDDPDIDSVWIIFAEKV